MPNFLVLPGSFLACSVKSILDIHDSIPETYGGKFGKMPKVLYKLLCLEELVCCGFCKQTHLRE
jgi:hypothetical protein